MEVECGVDTHKQHRLLRSTHIGLLLLCLPASRSVHKFVNLRWQRLHRNQWLIKRHSIYGACSTAEYRFLFIPILSPDSFFFVIYFNHEKPVSIWMLCVFLFLHTAMAKCWYRRGRVSIFGGFSIQTTL